MSHPQCLINLICVWPIGTLLPVRNDRYTDKQSSTPLLILSTYFIHFVGSVTSVLTVTYFCLIF